MEIKKRGHIKRDFSESGVKSGAQRVNRELRGQAILRICLKTDSLSCMFTLT